MMPFRLTVHIRDIVSMVSNAKHASRCTVYIFMVVDGPTSKQEFELALNKLIVQAYRNRVSLDNGDTFFNTTVLRFLIWN